MTLGRREGRVPSLRFYSKCDGRLVISEGMTRSNAHF